MIAYISAYLEMILAAVPFLVLFFMQHYSTFHASLHSHSSLNGIYNASRFMGIQTLKLWAVGFAAWQLLLSAYIYNFSDYIYYIRIFDPVFFAFFLFGLPFIEEEKSNSALHSYWPFAIMVVLAHGVAQGFFWWLHPDYVYASVLLSVVALTLLTTKAALVSRHTLIRYRICVGIWVFCSFFALPFFRVFFLLHVAWIFYRRYLRSLQENYNHMEMLEKEKRTVGSLMQELSGSIRDVSDLKESLRVFLEGLLQAIGGKAAAVYLWDKDRNCYYATIVEGYFFPLQAKANIFVRMESLHEVVYSGLISEPEHVIYKCGHEQLPMFYPYVKNATHLHASMSSGTVQSLMLAPITLQNTTLGVLVIQNKDYERYFTESDFSVVQNFSHHAAMMINSARLLEEKAERQRVDHELTVANRVQADLLPRVIPKYDGVLLAGSMKPAKEIGGDFYDFIPISEDHLGIVIADVSGKGVAAGMIMTMVHTLLHSLYPYFGNSKDLLVKVNEVISNHIREAMFVTLLFCMWDSKNKKLMYTGCGHEHILWFHKQANHLEAVRSGGLALGMTDDVRMLLKEKELPVAPGDSIVLYTDGIIEARGEDNEMYGLDRLKSFIESHHGQSAEDLRSAIVKDVQRYSQGVSQTDDITCIVVQFT
jgi:serine phosphatase RsbU (regulator of sigma subunit)